MKDYYKILGVNINSSTNDIKKNFRAKALKLHPDKSGSDTRDEFIELFEAYSILSDPKKRERYNLIYDFVASRPAVTDDTELKTDVAAIAEKGAAYSRNFKTFDKEVLEKILLDLLLVLDKLIFASIVAVLIGIVTIIKGVFRIDIEYTFVGVILTGIGLVLAKLKINYTREFEDRYYKSTSKKA